MIARLRELLEWGVFARLVVLMVADFILAIKSAIFLIGTTRLDHPDILLGVSSICLLSFVVIVLGTWQKLTA